jgi:M6 family metalloprotease-like protein
LPAGVDTDLLNGILFGNTFTTKTNTPDWSIDDFWRQGSDGQTSLPFASGAIKGPFTLPGDYLTCDSNAIFSAAVAAADSQVNFQNYSRVLIVMPNNSTSGSGCGWAGLGSLGCWSNSSPGDGTFTSSISWLRADQMTNRSNGVRLISHEMGHNLTLHHASSRDFPGPPREPLGALGVAGTLSEYGDLFSTMGSWNFGFYSAQHAAEMLSWFSSPTNYQVVQSNGSYSVQAYETRPAGKKALKIQRGTGNSPWLWLEYRQNQGIYDSQLGSQVWSGALLHYEDATTGTHTHLPDFTSATTSFSDPALAVGQTWTDPYSNLSISVDSAVSGTLNVTVTYGAVPCTQANPTVTLSPLNPTTQEGKPQNFTVSVTDNDSAGCSSGTLALTSTQPSAPAGWGSSFSPSSLTIAPGSTSTATLTKTPPAGSAGATYALDATATNGAFSGTGTDNVTVNIADFTISATPSSRSVAQGGSTTYTATVGALNGFTGNVALSVTGLPAGVTPTFSPTSITGSGSSTLTLVVGAGTATGTYTLTIRGDGPTTFHTANVILTVTPPAPDFTIGATPASQTVPKGGKATYAVTLVRLNGFTSNVSLSVSNLPTKATASFSPNPVTNPNTSSSLTVTTTSKGNSGTGTRTLTITGTGGGVTRTTTVNITVQ